ncbi:MAG: Serine phosphatase RsbU, regulator of sigma subunit [Olavius algarvensis Delta 4 endosymbiont]|nr:MAG: Serine phosphatase RsbU, regulator of sigma subunit [Olavius algarvensis Delta 4 endosymbiont]
MTSDRYNKHRGRGGIRAAAWSIAVFFLLMPAVLSATVTVRVGICPNEPLIFTGKDGRVQGVYNDILVHVAHKEKWTLKYVPGSWAECITRLNNHEIDLMTAIAFSEERRLIYDFNRVTVIENWGQVYLPKDSEVEAFLDLTGKMMAVLKDDIYYNTFRDLGAKFEIKPQFREVDSYAMIFKMLDQGEVASGIVSRIFGQYHDDRYRIKTSQMNFGPVELRFAIPKGRTRSVLEAIDTHLKPLKLRKNSIYHQSLDRWLEGSSKIVLPVWLNPAWVVGSIVALVLFIGSVSLFLRWQLRLRTAALEKTIAAKERIESDLRVAREIQMDLLPTEFPPFPERHEFDIFALIEPAREVGGDLFDFFFVDDDHLCFIIGDVSDKGVPAALFMARTKTLIKSMAGGQQHAAQILTAVNRELSINNDSMMFVTTFCGILKVSTGEVGYTNAGHNPPLVVRPAKAPRFLADTGDTALGIDEDLSFHEAAVTLAPGDTLFMYTDGVTEAFNDRQEEFSEARLQQTLSGAQAGEVSETALTVLDSVKRFAGEVPQSDDIAILALKYLKG